MKLIITWGLPASGKTNYTNKTVKKLNSVYSKNSKTVSVSHDDFRSYNSKDYTKNFLYRLNSYLGGYYDIVIADTLITTHEALANFLKEVNLFKVKNIEIQYWCEDRESCIWNDKYRRTDDSNITIMNLPIEKPTISRIKELVPTIKNITVVTNNVVRKSNWQMFADKYGIQHNDGEYRSSSWSMGGTSGNCWNNHISTVSGEPQPNFVEFDEMLEKICPTISFLQYKKIYNACVDTGSLIEGDYYGGSITYGYYTLNVQSFYDELSNLEFINLN